MKYRTVIEKRDGRKVAPSAAITSLKTARAARDAKAAASPHLTVVVQIFLEGQWEDY